MWRDAFFQSNNNRSVADGAMILVTLHKQIIGQFLFLTFSPCKKINS